MRWFKRKLASWVNDYNNEPKAQLEVGSTRLISGRDQIESEPILNFKIYSAVGGKVVEFRLYDRKNDQSFGTTYVITNDQDFGTAISKIATLEMLKK